MWRALYLAAAGVTTDEHGYIHVNERLETSAPGVYALGNVNGGPQFTHMRTMTTGSCRPI